MRTREIIKLMPTQYRQTTNNPLNTGHYIPLLGTWTKTDGYKKKQSLVYLSESLACPIIAVVSDRVGKEDIILTITAKTSVYDSTEEKEQGDYTIKRKKYIPTETTVETTLTIPRFTRQWATFLLTGLGKMCYEITSITDDNDYDTCKIEFYALASSGSKIIYWLGLHKLTETLRDILQGPWISPTRCFRCKATGIEPDTTAEPCKQCSGYKYSGYNATRSIQRNKGFDVGLARKVLDWDNMTDDDHQIVKEFINKAWTQKWWVTPTPLQIKRLFAHFLQLHIDDIKIEERFHLQEPVWRILLPKRASAASPFGINIYENYEDLLKYMARSVTPAGVSVFVGFYDTGWFGQFEFDTSKPSSINFKSGAFEARYKLWGRARWSFWNGWTNAIDHFERCTGQTTGQIGGIWTVNGDVSIVNVNDQNRHMAKFVDNSYLEHDGDVSGVPTGQFEMWVHPQDTEMRFGLADATGMAMYLKYDTNGFYDNYNNLLRAGLPHCDYHLRVDFVVDAQGSGHTGQYGYIQQVQINREVVSTGFNFIRTLGASPKMRIQNIGSGTGFMDAYGNSWSTAQSGYNNIGDNWQRLHPKGYGICNDTSLLYEGHYPATYSFENDYNGSLPAGWTDNSTGTCTVLVIAEKGGHLKVVEAIDNDGSGLLDFEQIFTAGAQAAGTVEFWIRFNEMTADFVIFALDHARLWIRADDWYYVSFGPPGYTLVPNVNPPVLNTLHHIKIDWRANGAPAYKGMSMNRAIYTIDGISSGEVSTDGPQSSVTELKIYTTNSVTGTLWLDALGLVWDTGYNEGDNLIEDTFPMGLHDLYIRKDRFWEKLQ